MPTSPSKKTLAAQAIQKADQAERLFRYQTVSDRNAEATRGAIQSGLGSDQQLAGAYSGATPRDYSKYSQGLIFENDFLGGQTQAWRDLKARGVDPATHYKHEQIGSNWSQDIGGGLAEYATAGGYSRGSGTRQNISPEQMAELRAGAPRKGTPLAVTKNKSTGQLEWVDADGDGQTDVKGGWSTIGDMAAAGSRGKTDMVRSWEVAGQVVEVQDLFEAANAAAKAGDFDTADAKHAEALAKVDEYGLNQQFDPTGLKDVGKGIKFQVGDVFDPMGDIEGQAGQALGSPTGMLVGQLVSTARQMQDPNSVESQRFKTALTAGSIEAVEASRTNAIRAMASEERGTARGLRDTMLQTGRASATARMGALAARTAERFASQRAGIETQIGAQKAQIFGEAGRVYETFRMDLAKNATALASAWVNDQSGVRDSFRAMHANMMMNYTSNLLGFASNANNNVTQLMMAASGGGSSGGGGGAGGALGGALGGAAAGATVGSAVPVLGTAVGAIGGAVVGGAAGYFS